MSTFVKMLTISYISCILGNSLAETGCINSTTSTNHNLAERSASGQDVAANTPGCSCGVFLSGQFVKGSPKPPEGNPAIVQDIPDQFICGPVGVKQCTNKCMEDLVKYLPNSGAIICGSVDRDTFKEKAYLFVNNCNNGWTNTNFSAGKEYCCKNGTYYKCPLKA